MPVVPRVAQANGLALAVLDVGDDQDLGVARELEVLEHMDLQRPEQAAEIDVLARRDALVAEHQYMVVEVGAVDARKVLAAQRARQVQTQHLGAQRASGAGHAADHQTLRWRIAGDGGRGIGSG